jgi:hypothetical protein
MAVSSTKHEKQSGVLVFDFVVHRLPDSLEDSAGSRVPVDSSDAGSARPGPDRRRGEAGATKLTVPTIIRIL